MATKTMYTAPGVRTDRSDKCYGYTNATKSPVYLRYASVSDFQNYLDNDDKNVMVITLEIQECCKLTPSIVGFADSLERDFGIQDPKNGIVVWAIPTDSLNLYFRDTGDYYKSKILLMCQGCDLNSKSLSSNKYIKTLEDYKKYRDTSSEKLTDEEFQKLSNPVKKRKRRTKK